MEERYTTASSTNRRPEQARLQVAGNRVTVGHFGIMNILKKENNVPSMNLGRNWNER